MRLSATRVVAYCLRMKSSVSSFWVGWLLAVLVINIAIGLSATFGIESYLWKWHQDGVATALWGETGFTDEVRAYRSWVMSIFGPTLMAWAIALIYITLKPFAAGERWAWICISTSLLAWFIPDTIYSVFQRVWINVVFNSFGFGAILLPLIATRKSFWR